MRRKKTRTTREKIFVVIAFALLAMTMASMLSGCGNQTAVDTQTEASDGLISVAFSEVGAESDWRVANSESMRTTFTEENGYEFYFEDAK